MSHDVRRYRVASIGAASILAVGLAVMAHELAHVLVGWAAGGTPTLLTATEVPGDFSSLSPVELALFGASGSIANVLLSALGWWSLRRRTAPAEFILFAWFSFAVNGMLVATKMMVEPLAGFGDWMTVLRPLPATMVLRVVVASLGTLGVYVMVRRSGSALGKLIPPGVASSRKSQARRIVVIGALAATILLLGSTVTGPVGTTRGVLLAIGAGLGPFIPMLFAARLVPRTPARSAEPPASGGWRWFLAPIATALVMWFVVGPGIPLS